ncbi:DUF6259 domain-containing protein [Rhodocytophaga aerolata]|uniref:DUF6259 domain-containing protein n=1 Tax=Rhodocytophaga aerolata TaxID=455078 RepID=A0ABT8RBA5_9BACT|nr:DUF6259 domain-containing protein [Rhodocytophaga aerolata]MDO1449384.1 DUF6259 domain-containing protein [Rhodocytophaga aerolata]
MWINKILLSSLLFFVCFPQINAQSTFTIKNENIEVSIDNQGNLQSLKNLKTGYNYASGKPIWRLYYDRPDWKDNEVIAANNQPQVKQQANQLLISYTGLKGRREKVNINLQLTILLENDQVRFAAELQNKEEHSIVRELQYPLVGNCQLPEDHQLLTTEYGGQLFPDVISLVKGANAAWPPYYPPAQDFLQRDVKYPRGPSANCYAFVGKTGGLYFGSHDPSFEDTGHGLRLYPSKKFVFDQLEAGMYKYPNCVSGQTWTSNVNVVSPYQGTWHETSRLYRTWANTWWKHREPPQWVKEMKGWQRIIMKHQYGEILFPYTDLSTRVKKVGESVGINTVFAHGWHKEGHDNDYPNYIADPTQGGEAVLKKQIAEFQKDGGAVIWYYSGRLIDKTSQYYRSGMGKKIAIKDNTGSKVNDAYRFRGPGTFTGSYDARTFTVADFRTPQWKEELKKMADQTIAYGAKSVFYDQMGMGDNPDWDLTGEFAMPNLRTVADKAEVMGLMHDYLDSKDKEIALGIEVLTDVTSMQSDYIHWYGPPACKAILNPGWEQKGEKPRTVFFMEWFRYTFPEIIVSDRDIRDDTDIERRVNHTVLRGLRNDVEIYRCRALIDETPHYQAYLAKVNQLKDRFKHLLLVGKYTDAIGFSHANPEVDASRFEKDNQAAIVFTQHHLSSANTVLTIPQGYSYETYGAVGTAELKAGKETVNITMGKHALVVVVVKKK